MSAHRSNPIINYIVSSTLLMIAILVISSEAIGELRGVVLLQLSKVYRQNI